MWLQAGESQMPCPLHGQLKWVFSSAVYGHFSSTIMIDLRTHQTIVLSVSFHYRRYAISGRCTHGVM